MSANADLCALKALQGKSLRMAHQKCFVGNVLPTRSTACIRSSGGPSVWCAVQSSDVRSGVTLCRYTELQPKYSL